ncbi:presqualene diphosphate synthase HpnD [Methyloferula stellata]|uniref:presqualene diphosphate synthase HpnD n=1 Tax=Methyloferula stellata TaxID=876270 RepID=UPI000379BFD2|nr:presqualene diphosphate synthase HpnD [Methyloferula stellata]
MSDVAVSSPPDAAQRASKSSFYTAMRILPKAEREAMFEIYSFCRAVDDIADDGGPRPERAEQLNVWRTDIDALYAGTTPPAHLAALAEAIRAFDLQREDFHAVIDGMDMDVAADIQAPDFATLDLYCDRVASAVGRLSVNVFGVPRAHGRDLAHHLGRAFQLTNILRDVDEDAEIDRLYLPREALEAAGIHSTSPKEVVADPALGAACQPVIEKAKAHFATAYEVMALCPRVSVKAPRIMGIGYHGILDNLIARGFAAPRKRVSVSKLRLLLAIVRYGFL